MFNEIKKDTKIDYVVGANFGDEGKGLVTDTLALQAVATGERVAIVLNNGGCQRGHTVDYKDGYRHVYHHFGSGTLRGADTIYDYGFIVNPAQYVKELNELRPQWQKRKVHPVQKCASDVAWSTIYDMTLSQLVSELIVKTPNYYKADGTGTSEAIPKNNGFHNSCGFGVWDTQRRTEAMKTDYEWITLFEFVALPRQRQFQYLSFIREYCERIFWEDYVAKNNWSVDKQKVEKAFNRAKECDDHFIADCETFYNNVIHNNSVSEYDHIIIEKGQGLGLDKDIDWYGYNTGTYAVTTSSHTGVQRTDRWLDYDNVTVNYVSRTYLTRHGTGELYRDHVMSRWYKVSFEDKTNCPNNYQGIMKYGRLAWDELNRRIQYDYQQYKLKPEINRRYFFTHWNEIKSTPDSSFRINNRGKYVYCYTPYPEDIMLL